jgi:ribosomal protein S3
LKDRSFKNSLQKGLAKIAAQLSNKSNLSIVYGIKIIACGRWRKTKKGRSQKISLIVGGLKAQSSTTVINYGFSTIATKFGACGIKI